MAAQPLSFDSAITNGVSTKRPGTARSASVIAGSRLSVNALLSQKKTASSGAAVIESATCTVSIGTRLPHFQARRGMKVGCLTSA